jgi:hypothetical protein
MMTTARHHLSKADSMAVITIKAAVPPPPLGDLTGRFAEMVCHGRPNVNV